METTQEKMNEGPASVRHTCCVSCWCNQRPTVSGHAIAPEMGSAPPPPAATEHAQEELTPAIAATNALERYRVWGIALTASCSGICVEMDRVSGVVLSCRVMYVISEFYDVMSDLSRTALAIMLGLDEKVRRKDCLIRSIVRMSMCPDNRNLLVNILGMLDQMIKADLKLGASGFSVSITDFETEEK